jgi:hypothetical protein
MTFLFSYLLGLYVYSSKETKLVVDTSRGDRLRINVSCDLFSIDGYKGSYGLICSGSIAEELSN